MPSRETWMATRKAVTRKSLQSLCRDHTETRLFMGTFFSHILITGWNYSFWSDINFHIDFILEFKFDGKTVCGWSKNLQGGPTHHATKLTGFVPRSELEKIGPNEVWFTRRAWSLDPNDAGQVCSLSRHTSIIIIILKRRGPCTNYHLSNYLGINFPNFAPSGDKF